MRNRMSSASQSDFYAHRYVGSAPRYALNPPRRISRSQDARNLIRISLARRASLRRSDRLPLTKRIADFFTLLRLILGAALVWSGVVDGQAAPARDIWLLVMAWSTDMVDGRISRWMKTSGQTWLGKNDVYVDMFVSAAVLVYLAVTSLLPVWLLVLYLLLWGALVLKWGLPPIFAQAFQNPIYAFFVFVTVQSAPGVLPWLLIWALLALAFFWRRLFELLRGVFRAIFPSPKANE